MFYFTTNIFSYFYFLIFYLLIVCTFYEETVTLETFFHFIRIKTSNAQRHILFSSNIFYFINGHILLSMHNLFSWHCFFFFLIFWIYFIAVLKTKDQHNVFLKVPLKVKHISCLFITLHLQINKLTAAQKVCWRGKLCACKQSKGRKSI